MAISLSDIRKDASDKPPRIFLYGVEGIGKTEFASLAPSPILIQTEDGLGSIEIPHFPRANSWLEVKEAVTSLCNEPHEFKTVVVDSLDWLEPLIWQQVCLNNRVNTIEDLKYGRGYLEAVTIWEEFLGAMDFMRNTLKMTVILIGHNEAIKFTDPLHEPYNKYTPKLHKRASPKITEWADIVLFANYRIATKETDVGFNNKSTRAVGSGERILNTQERPSFMAKNRFSMPAEIPMEKGKAWQNVAQYIPFFNRQAQVSAQPQEQSQPETQTQTVEAQ